MHPCLSVYLALNSQFFRSDKLILDSGYNQTQIFDVLKLQRTMWFGMIYCSIVSENSFREESKKVKVFIEELWLFQNDLNDTLDTKNPKMALSVLESNSRQINTGQFRRSRHNLCC